MSWASPVESDNSLQEKKWSDLHRDNSKGVSAVVLKDND